MYFTTSFYFWQVSLQDNRILFTFYRQFSATYCKTFDKAGNGNYNNYRKEELPVGFKVRIDISPDGEDEIVIRCKQINDDVIRLQKLLSGSENNEIELNLNGSTHFVKTESILFFETAETKTVAHTKERMYYSDLKLYELEERLPRSFMRISKSSIINTKAVSSIHRDITGICEAYFPDTAKMVYISRSYYKAFKDKINETRL